MSIYRKRLQNRLLQLLYKPHYKKSAFPIKEETRTFFNELEAQIEAKITPLLDELFNTTPQK